MEKCIILSLKAEDLFDIISGKKTIFPKKSMPKCNYPIDVYLYCKKNTPNLFSYFRKIYTYSPGAVAELFNVEEGFLLTSLDFISCRCNSEVGFYDDFYKKLNGKIVAKFTLNKVDKYQIYDDYCKYGRWFKNDIFLENEEIEIFLKKSCLTVKEIGAYVGFPDIELFEINQKIKEGKFYAWYINNLEILNIPMELIEFYRNCDDIVDIRPCNCGKTCEYSSYDLQENCKICLIDYDGKNCPFVRVQRPPLSWCYAFRKNEVIRLYEKNKIC